jgi:geranylgeranylglycerol-phosphate geranylgeranyltransferase
VAAFLICGGGYALNDVLDLRTDRVAKPWRPLPSGRLSPRSAVGLASVLWALGLAVAAHGGLVVFLFAAGWLIVLWLYSWRLKATGLAGHVAISITGASGFLLGGLVGGDVRAAWLPFAIAALFHLAREIAKSVVDAEGDRVAGLLTLAVRLGRRRALVLTLAFILAVVVASLLPFALDVYGYLYMLPVALVIYPLFALSIVLIVRARRECDVGSASRTAARCLKIAMPVGLLAFLLAGV